ncbi:Serine/threonine-protein kinase PLK4-like Protein [Tribolium castaneum]|uniref:Serine/threonine-protein kinase PLK4 n=2 Tax=Tribolium castaneum TaxID=7070 RepID=D6W9Q2_TRICA|nr:Serine/threonine-protein kinase PLK4-like Protein [Tribolium castaneum]
MGERIEDYEVYNLLGKGGFASVYHAKCLKTGLNVAIKMIDKKMMQAAGMVKRVEQEVSIHYRLKHPSILELYTFFEDANYVYLVLELCHNGELRQYIKTKALTESEVSSIMKQVVEGMKYLHTHNILHRDISLSNLLLTKDMQVKIADFGLATQLSRPDEKHTTMCGTPNFISPEVLSRTSHGLEADVWGLGCLLYNLLVGSPPFDTHGVKNTLNRIVSANFHLPSHLSPEAKDLINSLLQKNPKDRIKLDQILEHPFITRGQLLMSHLTHDSGIHTMSSRRDSAFSEGASNNIYNFKSNSHNMEQLSRKLHDVNLRSTYSDPPLFSNCGEIRSHCSCELPQNNAYPADPGGNRILKDNSNYKPIFSTTSNSSSKSDKSKTQRLLQLCSQRLLPKTHRTENSILHIMEDGEVVVELMKKKGSAKRNVVCDVLRISSDGAKITIYEPNGGKGVTPGAAPPPIPPQGGYEAYTIENLPEKHWKKYMHAYQFVALIKEKTPKVTCYNDKMKCVLMENLTDFEATFYEGGTVTKSSLKGITFQDSSGNKLLVKTSNECRSLTGTFEYMWSQSQEALKHCLLLEEMLSKLAGPNFPAIIGRRPCSGPGKENQTQTTMMPSFAVSMNSTAVGSFQSSSSLKEKKVSVPGVGTAVQLPNGEVQVRYGDGSQLSMDGKHQIKYQYSDGNTVTYSDNDNIPRPIREKLQHMPKILKQLMPSPTTHNFRL